MPALIAPPSAGPILDLTLVTDFHAPSRARSAIAALEDRLPPGLVSRLSLVTSELMTNAVRHAGGSPQTTLSVRIARERVVVEVASMGPPFDRCSMRPEPGVNGGFGLRVVDALCDRWWVETEGPTQVVVCEFGLG